MRARIVAFIGVTCLLFLAFMSSGSSQTSESNIRSDSSQGSRESLTQQAVEVEQGVDVSIGSDDGEEFKKVTSSDSEYQNIIQYKCLRVRLNTCRSSEWSCRAPCTRFEVLSNLAVELVRIIPESSEGDTFFFQRCADPLTFLCADKNGTIYNGDSEESKLGVHLMMSKSNSVIFSVVDRQRPSQVTTNVIRVFENSYLKAGPMNNVSRPYSVWHVVEHTDFRKWIVKLPPVLSVPRANISIDPGCDKGRHGCCNPKPLKLGKRLSDTIDSKISIGTLVLSSGKTLMSRINIMMRWIKSPMIRVILNTDCIIDDAVDVLEDEVVAWIIGPSLPPVVGDYPDGKVHQFNEVALRATLAIHWMYTVMMKDWYICVDDDTLVFPNNLAQLLTSLPRPGEVEYLAGHGSEFDVKLGFHGNYPFGGSGLVVSGGLRSKWVRKFKKAPAELPEIWLPSGKWNYPAGDGAICRLLDWSVRSEVNKDHPYFVDIQGFHQFDIVGTAAMNKLLNKTCTTTPSTEVQVKLWFQDVIGAQPVYSLHHIVQVEEGVLIPGLSSPEVIDLMYAAYESPAVPQIAFLRRHCDTVAIRNQEYYFCINFGMSIQFYLPSVIKKAGGDLKTVKRLLEKTPGKRSPTSYTCLKVMETPQSALLSSLFLSSADDMERYTISTFEPLSDKLPTATRAEVVVKSKIAEITFYFQGEEAHVGTSIHHLIDRDSLPSL